jgi:hypothetical protein
MATPKYILLLTTGKKEGRKIKPKKRREERKEDGKDGENN